MADAVVFVFFAAGYGWLLSRVIRDHRAMLATWDREATATHDRGDVWGRQAIADARRHTNREFAFTYVVQALIYFGSCVGVSLLLGLP